ncbi:MAG: 50S ribosomal protein L17 [Candidatus Brennerbacteria bacterium CG11_big_fil_rev_8_21_14_0_20_43_10]|uniref:50S ribosomal protein L17 n=3 Tax=Candidatus Brenneribacteriota TaxID=1817902 RepID=A0A2M8C3T7_9BACT|nr:MAG: 50S ribosomal protein L17 [Parcubacteria group bacterium CG1_02_44_31]PIP50512.1 MAG: 50S ribosomal protein L17 [Candidatus Brennerbacteria bacterium CG23_combo_of_CG06-09_8_20_14_all_44_41]PIR26598.1 MAG: 50S ribosomal protein L17 [Candidatus Brennerbacteria bacterium CG11_big_fil_rev_8_21_14_0_20_43_10]PIX28867.1 MAG: 50S ribosomal protein L17 [Candidatus Brennerbacteria bacterium CG_4_8_14_3_um_filter_43_14]PJA19617.1 MAG: 50S ribosomal protein L17 [Candidatus Brennerbacteria bacteri
MRHRKVGKKFGRKKGDRNAFTKSLVHNLIMKEKITTTRARAKETARLFGPLMTLAKKQTLAAYRLLLARLPKKSAEKLYKILVPRFANRTSGCTRIIALPRRTHDASPMCIISLVEQK